MQDDLFDDVFESVKLTVYNTTKEDDLILEIINKYSCGGGGEIDGGYLRYDANVKGRPCHMVVSTSRDADHSDDDDGVIILTDVCNDDTEPLTKETINNNTMVKEQSNVFLVSLNLNISPVDIWIAQRTASQLSKDVGIECRVLTNGSQVVEYMLEVADIVLVEQGRKKANTTTTTAAAPALTSDTNAAGFFLDTISQDRATSLLAVNRQQPYDEKDIQKDRVNELLLLPRMQQQQLEFSQIVSLSLRPYCCLDQGNTLDSQEIAEILFLLYRIVATPQELLEAINEELNFVETSCNKTMGLIAKSRYLNLLVSWYQTYGQDFCSESMISQLADIVETHIVSSDNIMYHIYLEPLCTLPHEQIDIDAWWGKGGSGTLPSSVEKQQQQQQESSRLLYGTFDNKEEYYAQLLSSPTEILAIEISRISWFLFQLVNGREMIRYLYWLRLEKKGDKIDKTNMSHICDFMEYLDYLLIWSCNLILDRDSDKERAGIIDKLILLARQLLQNNDYASCGSIVCGLRWGEIAGLQCWESVTNTGQLNMIEKGLVVEKMDRQGDNNIQLLASPDAPKIPYIQDFFQHYSISGSGSDGEQWKRTTKMGFGLIYIAQCQSNPPDIEPPRLGLWKKSHLIKYNKPQQQQQQQQQTTSMFTYWSEESAQAQFRRYVALNPTTTTTTPGHNTTTTTNSNHVITINDAAATLKQQYYNPPFLSRNQNKHLFSDAMFLKIPLKPLHGNITSSQQQPTPSSSSSTTTTKTQTPPPPTPATKKKSWKWIKSNSSKLFQPN